MKTFDSNVLEIIHKADLGNNGYAYFSSISAGNREALRIAGYGVTRSDYLYVGGVRVYAPRAVGRMPSYIPNVDLSASRPSLSNARNFDFEAAILARDERSTMDF